MKEFILLKSGEIMMKGRNRSTFEDILMRNAKTALKNVGHFKISKEQSAFYVEPLDDKSDLDEAVRKLSRVFGFAGISRSRIVDKDFDEICKATAEYLNDDLSKVKTFKVVAKRSDKNFHLDSTEICHKLGGYLLRNFPNLSVDVHNPEYTVVIEIRSLYAFIHSAQLSGAGGIPVRSVGKCGLLMSGGIDSPVAGYMIAKRGVEIVAIHFESPPYTSPQSLNKVETLCEKMSEWCGPIKLYTVPFTKPQEEMKRKCHDQYLTIIMRRMMMRVAEIIAKNDYCSGLITGESLGQVASQTLKALACTEKVVEDLPVLRPLVGMDKAEIMDVARRIDTYETSILPFEDCCTVFTPKHPNTQPKIEEIEKEEVALDIESIVQEAVKSATFKTIG